jgi:hypothetical protein
MGRLLCDGKSALADQIADARRYAATGEAQLNQWRSRTFNR